MDTWKYVYNHCNPENGDLKKNKRTGHSIHLPTITANVELGGPIAFSHTLSVGV